MSDGIEALRALANAQAAEAAADAQMAENMAEQRAKPEPADATEREELVKTPRERERQDFYDKPTVELTAESPTVDGFSPNVDDPIDSVEDTQPTIQFDIDG